MKTKQTLSDLLALHVIALTISGNTVYLAREGATWDGCWFTRDLSEAKTYKLARNAEKRIAEQGTGPNSWEPMNARVTTKQAAIDAENTGVAA